MAESLRIAFVVPFLFRFQRGIERSAVHLANELAHMGHRVTLLAWAHPHSPTDWDFAPGVRIFKVPYFRYFQSRWAVLFFALHFLANPYDFVNLYFAGYGEAAALARPFRRPRVNFIAGYPYEHVPHRFEEFRRFGLDSRLYRILVKSGSIAPAIERFFGRPVHPLPNGVDASLFDPAHIDPTPLRRQLGLAPEDRILLTVAALEERKGIQHVIRALSGLLADGLSVHYLVVGDGPYLSALQSLVADRNLAEHVCFTGLVKDVRPYYALADLFLLLSYGEAFPNVLLEAWAMQLPTIVSRHPPFPEIAVQDFSALLDETDTDALQNVVTQWLAEPSHLRKMGRAARRYVAAHYNWSAIAKTYLQILDEKAE